MIFPSSFKLFSDFVDFDLHSGIRATEAFKKTPDTLTWSFHNINWNVNDTIIKTSASYSAGFP